MGNFNNLLTLAAGSLQPVFSVQFFQPDGVTPLNIATNSGVFFRMRSEESNILTINNAVMVVTSAGLGKVFYQWTLADVAVAGRYLAQVEVRYAVAGPLIMPTNGYYHILIAPAL
jgi:hypothetical protein